MKQIRSTALVAGALACCLFGCNSGNVYVPVSGVVTLNDKPYKNASVNFQPIAGDQNTAPGRASFGYTDENGRFTLKSVDGQSGATPGKHLIRISTKYSKELKGYEVWDAAKKQSVKSAEDPIPPDWNYDSKREFDVPSGGTDKADFKIVTK